MISIPISVTTYNVEVSVIDDKAQISVIPTVIEVPVSVNHGQSAAQVAASIAAACTKENITGLKKEDSPEFVDLTIPALNSTAEAGGEITPTLWSWIKSVFPGIVAKSVKSFIIGAFTILKDHATRIGLLEDKYIIRYVVPADATLVELTTDSHGNPLNVSQETMITILMDIDKLSNTGVGILLNSSSLEAGKYNYINYANAMIALTTLDGSWVKFKGSVQIYFSQLEASFHSWGKFIYRDATFYTSVLTGGTIGKNMSTITKITILSTVASGIKAGSIIVIKLK